MSHIKVSIDQSQVKGEGKLLYLITMIDTEDPEYTSVQLWRADDEEHLYKQAEADFLAYYISQDSEFFEMEIWNSYWVPTRFIGTIED